MNNMNQGERITKVETNFEAMYKQNNKDHNELKASMLSVEKKIDDFIDSAEKRFAPMYVKNIIVWAGGVAGAFLIILILSKLIK